jgi:hypothetical protein
MQATVYLFDDLTGRKRARWPRPADPRTGDPFVAQLELLLQRLGDLHLRISLARLPLDEQGGQPAGLGQSIVDNLQDPCALAGIMPDGSVVAAFLGPRGGYGVGDDDMAARIRRRFERALRLAGTERTGGSLANLTVAHCWSDEIFDVSSLVLDHASAAHEVVDLSDNGRSARRQPA